MIAFEWFKERDDCGWKFGRDDLFKFRVQLWRASVSWDRVPVTNMLRSLRNQIRTARRELTTRNSVSRSHDNQ